MAVGMLMQMPDGTIELYEGVMEALEWDTSTPPEGLISHCAGVGPGGLTVYDVWESADQFLRFAEDRLKPALAQAAGGEIPEIEPQFIPLHYQFTATAAAAV